MNINWIEMDEAMVYKYSVKVPLIYNRHELYTLNPDSEYRFGFAEPVSHSFKVRFITYEIPGYNDEGISFEDEVAIKVYNTYEDTDGRERKQKPSQELICEISGLLVDEDIYARKFAEKIVDKICKELSFSFVRHNCNRHIYQPRVEAAWGRAIYTHEEYAPFVKAKMGAISKNRTDDVIHVSDYIHMTDSMYMTVITEIPSSECDIENCLLPHSDTVEYLMSEYYSALGAEMVKSKFFHLFSMIEFCEQKYKNHNGAKAILSDDQISDITDCIRKLDLIKELDSRPKDDKEKMSDGKYVLSRITESLKSTNDTGRNKKLLNILDWMGIREFMQGGNKIIIDEKLIQSLTGLRNKSFHGTAESEKALGKYRDAVEKLMYINEKILDFVRVEEKNTTDNKVVWQITGKR